MEARLAIGLVLLAGVIALPVAVFAWAFGFVSFGSALMIYVLTGWAVMVAGFLSTLFGQITSSERMKEKAAPRTVRIEVKSANRG